MMPLMLNLTELPFLHLEEGGKVRVEPVEGKAGLEAVEVKTRVMDV